MRLNEYNFHLTEAEREQVDALIVRMRQPSQSPSPMQTLRAGIQFVKDAGGTVTREVPKKPEVYVPREDAFYEED